MARVPSIRPLSAIAVIALLALASGGAPLRPDRAARTPEGAPVSIGSRLEPFVDDFLIERMDGASLVLHEPSFREAVFTFDRPWEGNVSTYVTVFRDGPGVRMYYRGANFDPSTQKTGPESICFAESPDGIRWTRPDLGLFEFEGSKANNIVWTGPGSHNFTPFRDSNPACPPAERYKALGGDDKGLFAFASPDGIRWTRLAEAPVLTGSWFDSQNLAFYDQAAGEYREFHRNWRGEVRDIQTTRSRDFRSWSPFVWLDWGGAPDEQLYTNAVAPHPGAPHVLIGFPKRFLPERKASGQPLPGVSDGLFMSSRDGVRWKRWREAFLRPGLQKERWVNRNNMIAWGVIETAGSEPGMPDEFSIYSNEGYYVGPCRLRRHTVRRDGFVSIRAGAAGGEVLTRPVVFAGRELALNVSTSAAGSVRVELLDAAGRPVPGFAAGDCAEIYGDDVERVVRWAAGSDLAALAGAPVRLRFILVDADIYSLRFR